MPDAPPGWKLRQIARKTLSLDENDPQPVSHHYLQILLRHLEQHPGEHNFLMDFVDGGGTITCLDCISDVLVANPQGKLEGLDAFAAHIATPEHQKQCSGRYLQQEPVDVDMISNTSRSDSVSGPPSTQPSVSPSPPRRKRVMKTVYFPEGESFEYSTDEEEQPLTQTLHTPSTATTSRSPFGSSNNSITPPETYNSYSSPFDASSSSWSPFDTPSLYKSPFDRHQKSPFEALSSYSSLSNATGSNAQPSSSKGLAPAPPNYNLSAKRSRRGLRAHDFGDGDIIYLSTDDETVNEGPDASASKKPKLGGALIKNSNGLVKTESGGNHAQSSSADLQSYMRDTALRAYSALTNNLGIGSMPNQDPYTSSEEPLAQHSSWSYAEPAPVLEDEFHWSLNDFVPMPGGGDGLGLGYHAPAVPDFNPVAGNEQTHAAGYVYRPNAGSFNLNFDEGAPVGRIDMGGSDQAQKLKDFFVSAMEDFQEMPKVVDAAQKLGLKTTSDLVPGLEVQLMPHQLIGVSWMVEQEAKPEIKGGILADDMGLGKTVQCIATCVMNQPAKGDERRSTLVVAPAALLEQWAVEFKQRTSDGMFRVHIHHGKDKLRSMKSVQQYDVVITTYQTLCTDFPKDKKGKGKAKATAESEDGDSEGDGDDIFGPLATTEWHRVVLDEAQCIRNRATRASRCVARLKSTYRWALTGTPVTNTLADIYGLIRFLHFRPFNDWKEFNERFAKVQKKSPDLAGRRAQALLKKCLLRRTKNTKLEGKPILQLPPKHIEVIEIDFSPEEREIYTKIEERQKQRMSKFLKAGTVMKNYAVVLVMLLRLRQVCNHPQLLAAAEYDDDGDHVIGVDGEDRAAVPLDTSPAGELNRAQQLLGAQFVQEAKAKLREQAQTRVQAEAQGTGVEEEDTDCPICFDTYVNNCRITSCKHLFCSDCLNDLFKSPPSGLDGQDAAYAEAMQNDTRSCPVCRGQIHPTRVFKTSAFEPSAEELTAMRAATKGNSMGPPEVIDLTEDDPVPSIDVKGKGKVGVKDEPDLDALEIDSLDRGDDFEPSAKMSEMLSIIKQWHSTAPDDKIICYSQWTSMITLVEKLLARDDIETVRFDGKMSRIARDEAIRRFKKRSGPSIMLISLKCGGCGLNLVEANRVMCLDLAWNAATENQAFDRVHRMGQQKDVHVKRLIIRNTVEERILNLQATKQALADAALGEGKAQKIKKMSVKELKTLFGM